MLIICLWIDPVSIQYRYLTFQAPILDRSMIGGSSPSLIVISVAVSFVTVFFKFNFILPSIFIISDGLASADPSRIFFQAEELGFFDPEFPIEYGLRDMVRISK